MKKQEILKEIDNMIKNAKKNGILTDEEVQFFGALKRKTEEVDGFFARLVKNAGIKKKK
jgi:hypothetical protein